MKSLYNSHEYAHFSVRALALYALIMGYVACSSSTWYRQIKVSSWQRPRTRMYPKEKRVGIRKRAPNELYHLDITIIKLIDGTKVYIQLLMDNYSRYVLAWSVSLEYGGRQTAKLLRQGAETAQKMGVQWRVPEIFTDGGPENDNEWVDRLIASGYIIRTIAQIESRFSNSIVEALNRSLKVNCLYNHPLSSFADVVRLVNFYLNQHNNVMPHAAFGGATPLQMFTGQWTLANEVGLRQPLAEAKANRRRFHNTQMCGSCR